MLDDQRLELPQDLGVTAERELRLDQLLHRRNAQILEPRDLRLRERLVREIGEHRASPQGERLFKRLERLRRALGCKLGATLVEQALEAVRIHLLGADLEAVAVGTRDHDVAATLACPAHESLAQARDVDLKRLCGGGGRPSPHSSSIRRSLLRVSPRCRSSSASTARSLLPPNVTGWAPSRASSGPRM